MVLFFLLLLAFVLIGLFVESRQTRLVGFAVVGSATVALVAYTYFREHETLPPGNPAGTANSPAAEPGQVRQALTALKTSDAAVLNRRLEPVVDTYVGNDGHQYQRPNLYLWSFSGQIKNLSAEHMLKDLTLRVRLYSCPSYFTPSNNEAPVEDIRLKCTTNGERSVGLYDLDLPSGAAKDFSTQVTFVDQRDPVNWRFTVDVERAVAEVR
ncbi:MAG TPA: hypothetical protein VJS40_09630 [Aestuariivirgaceae bacterium]|nr:hypothetical protein [Aestuariivirgaceae bacterium]